MSATEEPSAADQAGRTLTFLFTDIEGSTKRWERHPQAMAKAIARHDEIMRAAILEHNGHVFKTVGDAFCSVFPTAQDAIDACVVAQQRLADEDWGVVAPIRVRWSCTPAQPKNATMISSGQP
jgi:class 3 adenylate cyclase